MIRSATFHLPAAALLAAILFCPSAALAADAPGSSLDLVPWPRKVAVGSGETVLGSSIVTTDEALKPLVAVLADEIKQITGKNLAVAQKSKPGDIVLKIDSTLAKDQYSLKVTDTATVRGGSYKAAAWGAATLLQALKTDGQKVALPRIQVEDAPQMYYRGLLIDVARRYNSINALKQVVVMCRLYKINYVQLHLTDDHAWTFPSKAFPKLGSTNHGFRGPSPKVYDLQELKDLVKFADDRGVTLVPELEMPGHSDSLRIPYPETFDANDGPAHMGIVDMTNPKAYEGLDTLIGEMCEVFQSSPFFHLGADEANLGRCKNSPLYADFLTKHGLQDSYDLYCYFVVEMDKLVIKHGRRTVVWGDGVRPPGSKSIKVPPHILAIPWRDNSNAAKNFVDNGFEVVNATWTPLYVVNQTAQTVDTVEDARGKRRPETIYQWNPFVFDRLVLDPTPKVLGAQMCAWEEGGEIQVPVLRSRVSAMSERVWNTDAGKTYADFARRLSACDVLLNRLLSPLATETGGLPETPANQSSALQMPVRLSAAPAGNIAGSDPTR